VGSSREQGQGVSGASLRSEGRWQWIPPTLILVAVAVVGIGQLVPDEGHPTAKERRGERAIAVCESHLPPGHEPGLSSPLTAGELVRAAIILKSSAAPWDEVPADHFVARCSYTSRDALAVAPTTLCPNGDIVSLSRPTQILADEEGRTSPDFASGPLRPLVPPC